jgi:hypothetical protein
MHRFFERAGGLTSNIRIDNLAACVSKIGKGTHRVYTERFERAKDYYGLNVLPCQPGKGNQKGDVERDIRTHVAKIRRRIKREERVFVDFDDLNMWLADYCAETTAELSAWIEERKRLRPLPEYRDNIVCRVEEVSANKHGIVRAANASYSVPDSWIGRRCVVSAGPHQVCISLKGEHISEPVLHPRQPHHGKSILLEHVISSLVRKPAAMIRWTHRDILFPCSEFERLYHYLQRTSSGCAESEFLRCLNIIHHVTYDDLRMAVSIILEAKSKHPFEDIKGLLLQANGPSSMIEQPDLDTDLHEYDQLIPNTQYQKDVS